MYAIQNIFVCWYFINQKIKVHLVNSSNIWHIKWIDGWMDDRTCQMKMTVPDWTFFITIFAMIPLVDGFQFNMTPVAFFYGIYFWNWDIPNISWALQWKKMWKLAHLERYRIVCVKFPILIESAWGLRPMLSLSERRPVLSSVYFELFHHRLNQW